MDEADDTTSTDGNGGDPAASGPRTRRIGPDWLALSQRQLLRMRAAHGRHAEAALEARQRPGTNAPPITDAGRAAYRQRKIKDIGRLLDRAQIVQPGERRLVQELIVLRHAYAGTANTAEVALEQIQAMVEHYEQKQIGDTTLKEQRALEPVRILCNLLRDALAHQPAPLLALIPKRDPAAGAPLPTTGAHIRAAAAVGLAILTLGKAKKGGITQEAAQPVVREAFRAAGIDFTPATLGEWFKRITRDEGKDRDQIGRSIYDDMIGPVLKATAVHWTRADREAALRRLADEAGRKLQT
jgi:hypothetical protein